MGDPYAFGDIEKRWQERWADIELFRTQGKGDPYYCLMMYPYPSGKLHMGHIINYTIGDALIRYHLMQGRDVMAPMGWDSFGLPAENHAIRTGTPPAASTSTCIDAMREQMVRAGFGYDWSRELATSHPGYYRWTQWLFLQFFKKGLAFKKTAPVNWCPACVTVLANEQVKDGVCERCGTTVELKDLEQWFFRMSDYAQRLLDGHSQLEGKWPDRVLKMQKEWIGRSEGAKLDFELVVPGTNLDGEKIEVFTTRPDTTYGVTFFSIAPEHPLIQELVAGTEHEDKVLEACKRMRNQDAIERTNDEAEKEGVFTGRHVRNPFDGSLAELWVANYVLMDYGTGAVMAVPAHDQRDFNFAKKYDLDIRVVIKGEDGIVDGAQLEAAYTGDGEQVNSGPFDGQTGRKKVVRAMTEHAKEKGFGDFSINYRLKDWLLSRQRYWGAPIPIVNCEKCGSVPVPEDQLPVLLPDSVDFRPTGESPLASCEEFVNVECPECGGPARRETDTMDTFVDSSWYYLRYVDPRKEDGPFDSENCDKWMPVHQYVGGIEHATMHLIYARFFTKVMHDLGLIPFDEPFERLFCQGMVCATAYHCENRDCLWLAEDEVGLTDMSCKKCGKKVRSEMTKMSKTKKNGVPPDQLFDQYGADTLHTAILFLGPADQDLEFDERGVQGVYRFLRRMWDTVLDRTAELSNEADVSDADPSEKWVGVRRKTHEMLKRATNAFEGHGFGFNTCIAGVMEVINSIRDAGDAASKREREICAESLEIAIKMLSPFAPHLC
ncbi:MAG: leucine--tRNA ligase, partial [Planctomycetota bacterium]